MAANAVYYANASAGANNGTSCVNAYAYSDATNGFNAAGNWSGSPTGTQIGPGTTVHLCGTISGEIAFQGSGSSGNVITLLFEPGAMFSNTGAAFNAQSPITTDGQNYIQINGGIANTGGATPNIVVTGNGSGLATQLRILAIHANGSSNLEILNFGCANNYVHTSVSDTSIDADSSACIYGNPGGQNVSIHDSTFHDNQDGILFVNASSGSPSLQVYNMNMYHMDHFLVTTCNSSTSGGWYVHDNQIHDPANWDTTANAYHHDGWLLVISTGQTCDQIYAYNNLFGGDWGSNNTSPLFFDQNGGGAAAVDNTYIFNNVFLNTNPSYPWSNGIALEVYPGPVHFWNNTVICPTAGGPSMEVISPNIDIRNNVESGCQNYYNTSEAASGTDVSVAAFDYNYYANLIASGGSAFSFLSQSSGGGSLASQFAAWQSIVQGLVAGSESHSGVGSSAGLNSSGVPTSNSSPVVGSGVNLCNGIISCTGTLAALASGTSAGNTITPVTRSASGAWTIGAYNYIPPPGSISSSTGIASSSGVQ